MTLSLILALVLTPTGAAGAQPAEPVEPTNSADAKQQWLDASRQAAIVNEQVLQANETVTATTEAAALAEQAVLDAEVIVQEAVSLSDAAQLEVDQYQDAVDRFANASFRGARLSQFTALLTADSPEDFLDEASTLERVAADAAETLEAASLARKEKAETAQALETAKAQAVLVQVDADAAESQAIIAAADLAAVQADLANQIALYETLYNQLSESERLQAIADQEERNAAAARAAGNPQQQTDVTSVPDPMADIDGIEAAAATNPAAQAAVDAALSKVGSAYVWGAAGPNSFDCSGLTSWAWRQAGVTIPRTSGAQNGLTAVPLDELQPGDLVTFYSPVSHVAMYIGNGQIVQASTESKPVYVTDLYRGGPNPTGHRP